MHICISIPWWIVLKTTDSMCMDFITLAHSFFKTTQIKAWSIHTMFYNTVLPKCIRDTFASYYVSQLKNQNKKMEG